MWAEREQKCGIISAWQSSNTTNQASPIMRSFQRQFVLTKVCQAPTLPLQGPSKKFPNKTAPAILRSTNGSRKTQEQSVRGCLENDSPASSSPIPPNGEFTPRQKGNTLHRSRLPRKASTAMGRSPILVTAPGSCIIANTAITRMAQKARPGINPSLTAL